MLSIQFTFGFFMRCLAGLVVKYSPVILLILREN